MKWELLGGVAAGLADAKRRADQDREMSDYRKAVKDYYKSQVEAARRKPESIPMPSVNLGLPSINAGPARPYLGSGDYLSTDGDGRVVPGLARGGMVGYQDSEITEWDCRGMSSDLWQKQSFKK